VSPSRRLEGPPSRLSLGLILVSLRSLVAPRDLRLARRAPFTALPMRKIPGASVSAG